MEGRLKSDGEVLGDRFEPKVANAYHPRNTGSRHGLVRPEAGRPLQKYENGKNRVGASRLHWWLLRSMCRSLNSSMVHRSPGRTKATKSLAFDPQALRFAESFVKSPIKSCARR